MLASFRGHISYGTLNADFEIVELCTVIDYFHVPLFLCSQLQNSGWTRSMKRVTFVGPAGWNAWLDSFFTVNLFGHACRMKFVSWPESRAYFLHYKLAVIIGFFVDLSRGEKRVRWWVFGLDGPCSTHILYEHSFCRKAAQVLWWEVLLFHSGLWTFTFWSSYNAVNYWVCYRVPLALGKNCGQNTMHVLLAW